MQSRISGIGLSGIARKALALHEAAWTSDVMTLPVGGIYKLRRRGEAHAFDGTLIHLLQHACNTDSYARRFKQVFSEAVRRMPPIALRDLLDFRTDGPSRRSDVDEVESVTELRKRLLAPGISLGALSPEAHETLSIAMNRIGARSPTAAKAVKIRLAAYRARGNGDNASSAIKQIASGRFGVTAAVSQQLP